MEFQLNAAYFPSTELNSQCLVSYQTAEEAAPASATDPWMAMTLGRWDWNAGLPTDPSIAAQYFAETPQITQVPQAPIPYILPEPQWIYQDLQPTGPSFYTSIANTAGIPHTSAGASPSVVQDGQVPAWPQRSARQSSNDPARRRELTARKSTWLGVLRRTLGASPRTTKFDVLNMAIEELGGHTAETATLAYQELHRLTGHQGKLRHVECLQAVDDALNGRHTLTIRHYQFRVSDTVPTRAWASSA